MPAWENFKNIGVPPLSPSLMRPRFSLTSDIVSYRRCSRQYGYFGNDGFVPAQAAQIYYGTVIHQVLDRCHRHYAGLIPGQPKGTIPTDAQLSVYFSEVENALKSHGVRPASKDMRAQAEEILKTFNRVEGPTLYPRVHDTEFRLESDRADYVLRGVVDVLVKTPDGKRGPGDMEIWDYKGTKMPDLKSAEMKDYEWQMCVYADLYKARSGHLPIKASLYFLNELKVPVGGKPITARPMRAIHEVLFTEEKIASAIAEFDKTAKEIMVCRQTRTWPLPSTPVAESSCTICDLRWNCPKANGNFPLRSVI